MSKSEALANSKTGEAISILNKTWPVVESAYKLLIADGMPSKKARTLCTAMIDVAFAEEKKEDTNNANH